MFNRFTKEARAVVRAAELQARELGARTVEAEHLLLALVAAGTVDLDHEELLAALDAETRVSLDAVGVRLGDYGPLPVRPYRGRLRFGASARLALERSLPLALGHRDTHLQPRHIALAVLTARAGTVPRALAISGIDSAGLVEGM